MFGTCGKKKKVEVEKVIERKVLEKISLFSLFGFARKLNENEKENNLPLFVYRRKRKGNNKTCLKNYHVYFQ